MLFNNWGARATQFITYADIADGFTRDACKAKGGAADTAKDKRLDDEKNQE